MIIKTPGSWFLLMFRFQGSSLVATWPRILFTTLFAAAVTVVFIYFELQKYSLTTTPFTLIGLALGIFLGFRNNAAYDRFWEGRKLWGALVNTSRSLARQTYSLWRSRENDDELFAFRQTFVRRQIAFVHALRHHLRDTDPSMEIEEFLPAHDFVEVKSARHRPLAILKQLGEDLSIAHERNWLHELNVPAMDAQLVELSNILGACERIKLTPIPYTYTLLIHRLVATYCLALPFGLIDNVGAGAPLVVLLIAYAFYGLDDIGDEIEQPFGVDPNHLPLTTISRAIEINLLELLGETNLPDPLTPKGGVLQ